MGSIYDPIEETVMGGGKDFSLNLKNLAKRGPKLQFDKTITDFAGLFPICFFHRDSISKLENYH
jgi:hypothetical protein